MADDTRPQIEIDDAPIIAKTRELLDEIRHRTRMTLDKLAEKSGLSLARVKAILYPESQGAHHLPLSDIRKVAQFGSSVIQNGSLPDGGGTIRQRCSDLAYAIYNTLDFGAISPAEYAFLSQLKIDTARQRTFSSTYAGVYANIRFTRSGYLGVARMDIFPQTDGGVLCRFKTSRLGQGAHRQERIVRGYIYEPDDGAIQALGSVENTGLFRTTVLKPFEVKDSPAPDLIGLRLSVSDLDNGPFASRLYCKRLVGKSSKDELEGWDKIFKSHPYNEETAKLIGMEIYDIDRITKLLREDGPDAQSWGVALPEGD